MLPSGLSNEEVLPPASTWFSYWPNPGQERTDGDFSVSRTGRYIVRDVPTYSEGYGGSRLLLYDLKTGSVKELTSGRDDYRWPAISPNGLMLAFVQIHHVTPFVEGEGSGETTTTDIMSLINGTTRKIPEHPQSGNSEIHWVSNTTLLEQQGESGGLVTVDVANGKTTQWVRRTREHFPEVYAATWTSFGIVYTSATLSRNSVAQRTAAQDGLYLTRRPVRAAGALLRRYTWDGSPPRNGLYSLSVLPGTRTLVAEQFEHIVVGPLAGRLRVLTRFASKRPQLSAGEETGPAIATPAAYACT